MKSEGVTVKPLRELTGNAMFNTVYIDDVFVPDECVLGEVNRGWEVSRNTLTAERVSIGSSDANFLASLPQFVEFVRDGQFDQIAQHRAGQLIAEGHAAKVLNLRSTLLTLAGGDAMPSAAISKLLSMRTGQGYAEFAVSSFGTDAAIGDTDSCRASGTNTCWPAGPPPSTAAPRRCSSTSSPSGCWGCPAIPSRQTKSSRRSDGARIGVNFFSRGAAGPVCPRTGPACSPPISGGSPPMVVPTPEAWVAPEAVATEAAVAPAPASVMPPVAVTTAPEVVVTAPGRRGNMARTDCGHRRDYGRTDCRHRRRCGVSGGGCAEKHCAGHRACADCPGGGAAGRRE